MSTTAKGMSPESARKLVTSAITALEGDESADKAGALVDTIYQVARQQAVASNREDGFQIATVSIKRAAQGRTKDRPVMDVGVAEERTDYWPSSFSGSLCVWFCTRDGECYVICIVWWFPVKTDETS